MNRLRDTGFWKSFFAKCVSNTASKLALRQILPHHPKSSAFVFSHNVDTIDEN